MTHHKGRRNSWLRLLKREPSHDEIIVGMPPEDEREEPEPENEPSELGEKDAE